MFRQFLAFICNCCFVVLGLSLHMIRPSWALLATLTVAAGWPHSGSRHSMFKDCLPSAEAQIIIVGLVLSFTTQSDCRPSIGALRALVGCRRDFEI